MNVKVAIMADVRSAYLLVLFKRLLMKDLFTEKKIPNVKSAKQYANPGAIQFNRSKYDSGL